MPKEKKEKITQDPAGTNSKAKAFDGTVKKYYKPYARRQKVASGTTSSDKARVNDILNFPARDLPVDGMDDKMDALYDYMSTMKDMPNGFRPVPVTDAEISWFERKRKLQDYLGFKDWLYASLNLSTPEAVELARQKGLLDGAIEEREMEIDDVIANGAKVAKLNLIGRSAWSQDDYRFAYGVLRGEIRIPNPTKAIWDPEAYSAVNDNKDIALSRGFFNYIRRTGGTPNDVLAWRQNPFPNLKFPVAVHDNAYFNFGKIGSSFGEGKEALGAYAGLRPWGTTGSKISLN